MKASFLSIRLVEMAPKQSGGPSPTTVFTFLGDVDDTTTFYTDKVKDPGKWSSVIKGESKRAYVVEVLTPLCKVFNTLAMPYVAVLGMTSDLMVLGNQLRLPVTEPSYEFTAKLKGIRLSEVPLSKNRRLLLQYLSYLTGKQSHADLYNAGNLAAVVHIKCTAKGIAKFRISSVLSSGDVVDDPSFDAPPALLDPALDELFHGLLTYFPMMMNAMRQSAAIDFINTTWRFSKLAQLRGPTLKSTVTAGLRPPPYQGRPPSGG